MHPVVNTFPWPEIVASGNARFEIGDPCGWLNVIQDFERAATFSSVLNSGVTAPKLGLPSTRVENLEIIAWVRIGFLILLKLVYWNIRRA